MHQLPRLWRLTQDVHRASKGSERRLSRSVRGCFWEWSLELSWGRTQLWNVTMFDTIHQYKNFIINIITDYDISRAILYSLLRLLTFYRRQFTASQRGLRVHFTVPWECYSDRDYIHNIGHIKGSFPTVCVFLSSHILVSSLELLISSLHYFRYYDYILPNWIQLQLPEVMKWMKKLIDRKSVV